jgi:ABC-2 type transport system ATP-binding protein
VELRGVSKRYRARGPWVLREIDAKLVPGQLIRVTGPNGCGKSTLLRLVCGASAPTRGRITARPRPGRAGYVPERFPPALPFTTHGYLTHLGRVQGLRGALLDQAVEASIERLGLDPYAGLPLRELSKGTCQKVAVAQALLAQPSLLVLDEAWTGLDAATRTTLDTAVGERLADGATVLFVDHDPARLAGRTSAEWSLSNGQLIESQVTGGTGELSAAAAADGSAAADGAFATGVTSEANAGEVGGAGVTRDAGAGRVVVIEFSGFRGDLGALRGLDGVVAAEAGRVRVDRDRSDGVLRWLLGVGGVHVERVGGE